MKKPLRMATRSSALALRQADIVREKLLLIDPALEIEYIQLTTKGDTLLETSLVEFGGKGLFIKELQEALLLGKADCAVHSLKDMLPNSTEGLEIIAICERAMPWDVLIARDPSSLNALPFGSVVGTSSLRRQCQLQYLRSDLQFKLLRGNVETRLKKLYSGEYDAIVLAYAGLQRLGFDLANVSILPRDQMLPAIGQGAIGVECREEDASLKALLKKLDHTPTRHCVTAERAMGAVLKGNCQIPIGGYAELSGDALTLYGMVGDPAGTVIYHASHTAPAHQATLLGETVAKLLLEQGADVILEAYR